MNLSLDSTSRANRPSLLQIALGILLCEGAGVLGAILTRSAVLEWYPTLQKPPWTPPAWVFGPAWTLLYLLMGVAFAYLWASPPNAKGRVWALRWFWIQLALGVAWSAAFFGLRAPALGYAVILVLWAAIFAFLWTASRVARPTLWLLLPYFVWVTFASALNFGILGLNVLKPKVEAMDADPRNQDPQFRLRKPTPGPGTPPPTELF